MLVFLNLSDICVYFHIYKYTHISNYYNKINIIKCLILNAVNIILNII